ncbi:MAG: MBL fold metallo-hydrolase [Eubacterium sp.]|nr:MBL fold metallo-hydrolase [Eubacterium sp.]
MGEMQADKLQTGKEEFIVRDYGEGIFSVSHPVWKESTAPGGALMQSWVILREQYGIVLDGGVPSVPGFADFLKEYFQKDFRMVNTHGHIDHIGENDQFTDVWLDKADWPLLLGGGIKPQEGTAGQSRLSYKLHEIEKGSCFNLGGRPLKVIHIPGHTPGSVMLFDERTGTLFSGDSVARRLLYGLSGWTPLEDFLHVLESLSAYPIRQIASMHDDFMLPRDLPQRIIENIRTKLPETEEIWEMPGTGERFRHLVVGDGDADPMMFDFVIPEERCSGL